LDVVALLRDYTDRKIVSGQVGTVVEILEDGVFEVEFSDEHGRAYAMCALKEEDLMPLHYRPILAAGKAS